MAEGDTLVNSVLGAVVTAVLASALPLAPILGGIVAGYLEGGSRDDGLRVGIYAGLIALVPLILILVTVGTFFFAMMGVGGHPMAWGVGGIGFVFFVFGFLFLTAYTVGLSAIGGWLGNYVRHDTDVGG